MDTLDQFATYLFVLELKVRISKYVRPMESAIALILACAMQDTLVMNVNKLNVLALFRIRRMSARHTVSALRQMLVSAMMDGLHRCVKNLSVMDLALHHLLYAPIMVIAHMLMYVSVKRALEAMSVAHLYVIIFCPLILLCVARMARVFRLVFVNVQKVTILHHFAQLHTHQSL